MLETHFIIMKKILFTLAVMFITMMTLNSCSKDEPTPSFQVPEVCHDWGASREHALQEMKKYGWTYTGEEADLGMNFEFKNNKDITSTIYVDKEKGILSVYVFYLGMNSFFDELKSELTKRINIIWETNTLYVRGKSIDNTIAVEIYSFYNEKRKVEGMAFMLWDPKVLE